MARGLPGPPPPAGAVPAAVGNRDVPGAATAGCSAVDWGPYEAAVRRWEHVTGRAAPAPAMPRPGRQPRLSAEFAEWMMGIPGWVTGVPGITRIAQLRLVGNGVVPRQAAAALAGLIRAAPAPAPGTGTAGQQDRAAA